MRSITPLFLGVVSLVLTPIHAANLIATLYPRLIIPLVEDTPDEIYNTQYNGSIAQTSGAHRVYTELAFDLPNVDAAVCGFAFVFQPGGSWSLTSGSGSGSSSAAPFTFDIFHLDGPVDETADTWNAHPPLGTYVGNAQIDPTQGFTQALGGRVPCRKNQRDQFLLTPALLAEGAFSWFETNNPQNGIVYGMWDSEF